MDFTGLMVVGVILGVLVISLILGLLLLLAAVFLTVRKKKKAAKILYIVSGILLFLAAGIVFVSV